jgi:ATP-binding cassette, subfamily B, bacterial
MEHKDIVRVDYIKEIPRTPFRFMWFAIRPKRAFFVGALVCISIAALLHQTSPYLFKLIIDAIEQDNISRIPFYLALYPLIFLCIELFYRSAAYFVARVCIDGKEYLYNQLSGYLLQHSHTYFSNRFAGSLMSKLSTTVNAFENFTEYVLWNYLDSLITFGSTLVFIMLVDVTAGVVLGGIFALLFVVNYVLSPRSQTYSKLSADAQSTQSGVLVDILSNTSIVRQFGRSIQEKQVISKVSLDAKHAEYKTRFFGEWLLVINSFIITFGFALMMWVLIEGYQSGAIGTGSLVFVLGLLMGMAYQLLFLGNAFQNGSQQFGQLKDGISEMLLPHDIVDAKDATPLSVSKGAIVWSNVSFTYGENKVFDNFNLVIPAGQRVGLVGSSGAGKTTFVSLLLRQNELGGGTIMIDGQVTAKVTQDSLRNNISVVPQEPALFHRTIRENIAYGNPSATDEEIIEVAKKAQAYDFIHSLPEKYDTLVGERGVKLSGGQKQRVAIARALLKNSPILILDEATSALDSESEVAIQQALHILMTGKTVVAIAHRLSTLREMDRIIVLENGKIIEDGTHNELSKAGGTYERLWTHQAGGFLVE